ncbi:MAG: hypothetical protein HYY06_15850 [Deltaproteobacteria bacterium]|nr:hypothetical protein [Deltaproteobacteria bacterium]
MVRHPLRILVATLAAILVQAGNARAVVVAEMSEETLAATAELIVQGRVSAMRSRAGTGVYWAETDVTLSDLRVVAGEHRRDALVVTVAGGRRGDRVQVVAGAPRFAVGCRYLAFLVRNGDRWVVQGWAQGLFRLEADPGGNDPVATRALEGLTVAGGRSVSDRPRRLGELVRMIGRVRGRP